MNALEKTQLFHRKSYFGTLNIILAYVNNLINSFVLQQLIFEQNLLLSCFAILHFRHSTALFWRNNHMCSKCLILMRFHSHFDLRLRSNCHNILTYPSGTERNNHKRHCCYFHFPIVCFALDFRCTRECLNIWYIQSSWW